MPRGVQSVTNAAVVVPVPVETSTLCFCMWTLRTDPGKDNETDWRVSLVRTSYRISANESFPSRISARIRSHCSPLVSSHVAAKQGKGIGRSGTLPRSTMNATGGFDPIPSKVGLGPFPTTHNSLSPRHSKIGWLKADAPPPAAEPEVAGG
jgi:hypothetical protein